ncbi:hypothetical protein Bccel_1618 [Pseudobacteroides cellulosolvens ATCC 35603 = DSM 2933]|uniref:Uncharacterized protein n=2 Tax=Pseudobacteroides cellulosolvens TaxID=35825 RepID=A0A0L6JKH2_9FIRM|nr:hypothetical protein [Pseudobacteroides cellulosolvens]KNY26356.1 hypothetical protein Bccel_1618 [Pseudobacteroides cellulosolvens ATCC 35603 = DSM 2933]
MANKVIDISQKYSHEIDNIKNKLSDLERGRIYEITNVKMDGYLATNVVQLKEMISDLIYKIEYDKDSISDDIGKAFENIDI